ncbi:MAG TPA: acyl carrier protein [Polyangiales bacterium]|nr:acyl carrier protein [Polyangiales bacterium]
MTTQSREHTEEFLVETLAKLLKLKPSDIDTNISFDRYGLDSAAAVELTGLISQWSGIELEPTLLYDYPSIDRLTKFLLDASTGAS